MAKLISVIGASAFVVGFAFGQTGWSQTAPSPLSTYREKTEDINWDFSTEYLSTSIPARTAVVFSERLDRLSRGRIKIVHHFGGTLGYRSRDQLAAVGSGDLPLADSFLGALGDEEPLFALPSIPFLATNIDQAEALWRSALPYMENAFAARGQKLLYATPWTPDGLWTKGPIDNLQRFQGLAVRTFDTTSANVFAALGAQPTPLAWADLNARIESGGLEAVLTSAEAGVNARLWRNFNTFIPLDSVIPLNVMHLNAARFNALPPDLQKAVLDAAKTASDFAWKTARERSAQNLRDMSANGVNLILPPAELHDALLDAGGRALDEWLVKVGPNGQTLIDAYRLNLNRRR